MKLWIARDKSGLLYLHDKKPILDSEHWLSNSSWSNIDFEYFPEVTFENSPQEVEIELVKDSKNKIKISEKILSYIKEKNKHITHFETIPELNSEWYIDKITTYTNVCNGEKIAELVNDKKEWLRLPLSLLDLM